MSRAVMQQALEALEWNYNTDLDNIPACEQWAKMLDETITALRAALVEPDSDYERGFVDGMNLQTKGSVDKAVNRMAEPEQEPVAWRYRGNLHEFDPSDWAEGPVTPLYTAPTPRKPLTDDEIVDIWAGVSMGYDDQINIIELGRAIERAHGIGEQHE